MSCDHLCYVPTQPAEVTSITIMRGQIWHLMSNSLLVTFGEMRAS